jgi:hypothetical protein
MPPSGGFFMESSMATNQQSISAQGSKLHIATGVVADKAITGVQLTNPVVITSPGHGRALGDVVTLAGIVGTTGLNGITAVVQYVTADTFALAGVDASAMAEYDSGGTVTPVAWTQIQGFKSYNGFDGQANELDNTDLDSEAEEIMLGIKRFGNFTAELNKKFGADGGAPDPGQLALVAAFNARARKTFRLTLPNGKTKTFDGYVRADPLQGGVDALLTTSVPIRITGDVVNGG